VASSDDLHVAKQDAGLSCIAPSEGRYVVELRETAYRGNNESTYRLHVGGFPRPAMVFPPGGRAGEEVEVRWIGGEATGGTAKVTLPEAAGSTFEYFPEDDRGTAPSP